MRQTFKRFAAVLLVAAVAPAAANAAAVNFDEVTSPCCFELVTPGGAQGPNLTYGNLSVSGGVIMNGNSGWAGLQTSGDNLYGTSDFFELADDSLLPGVIELSFGTPVNSVGFDVINGFGAARFLVSVFNALSVQIASASFELAQFPSNPGARNSVFFGFGSPAIGLIRVESAQAQGAKDFAIDSISFQQVPEPGSLALLGIGLVGLGLSRRRRAA